MKSVISVAPMMNVTNRHFRYFLRLISPSVLLYTEMITTGAILYDVEGQRLSFDATEHPVALQLGGADTAELAICAKIGQQYGYDEINLNVGCPSDRVQSGQFGACLMKEPQLVADCIGAMRKAVTIPVTVKTRIGVDEFDDYENLYRFVELVSRAGCNTFIIHARKAWLNGLSPKQNRKIPSLRYDVVHQIKRDFPHLKIIINGGFKSVEQTKAQLAYVDGVMLGREIWRNPYILTEFEPLFENHKPLTRLEVLEAYIPYVKAKLKTGVKLTTLIRSIPGLFHGVRGVGYFKQLLSEEAHKPEAGMQLIYQAKKSMC